jgi:hypothetical protein
MIEEYHLEQEKKIKFIEENVIDVRNSNLKNN